MALTQTRAQQRFACIKQHSIFYNFHISLEIGTSYNGLTELQFDLLTIPKQLAVCFKGQQVKKVFINDIESKITLEDGFILLDIAQLKQNTNKVGILYRNKYDNDGSGCCSFTDVDGKQYIYTQFQSYFANRVMPCFDQPDLKAQMRLNVIAPMAWKKVLSNEYAQVQKQFNKQEYTKYVASKHQKLLDQYLQKQQNNKMILFPITKLISTYLYCFVAGQYCQLKLPKQQTYNNIPMSLYCIESLYKYLENIAPFIFEITIQSLKFYEEFFGYKFAWDKYDQIFAHQYKWGAMQNAGIVTYNDIYLWKQKVSTEKMLNLANTITHEMSHHWFGNLVTMKWWDDVWLNESFADFISHFCLEKIKDRCKTIKYQSSMASFLHRKGWGYHEDQMITTHPIRGPVINTSIADSIFDGITYSKGAATMKQFMFIISEEKFSKALAQYFKKYQWKNATLIDFMDEMRHFYDESLFKLDQWRHLWLQKASVNQIEASWNPDNHSNQAELVIKQTYVSEEHQTLRPHMIKVGLIRENFTIDSIKVFVKPQPQTITQYDGSAKYKAILLNFEDHTFVKNVIDPISLQFFSENLKNISDILSRTLIWRSFFEMVKDAKMVSTKYIEIVINALADESSDSIFQKQLDYCSAAISAYTPIPYRDELYDKMFKYILDLIQKVTGNQNRTVILKSKLSSFSQTTASKKNMLEWRQGKFQYLKDHQMTITQKWSAVVKAFTLHDLSIEEKEKIFEEQNKIDSSDTSKLKRLTCNALRANKEEFQKIYLSFREKNSQVSITAKQVLAHGWNHPVHNQWLLQYKSRYFSDISEVHKQMQGDHFQSFYEFLQPIDDDLQGQIKSYESIKLPSGKLDKNIRDILKIVDNLKRRLKTYQLFQVKKASL